jgi:hypothetical protein
MRFGEGLMAGSKRWARRSSHILVAALLAGLCLLFFWRVLTPVAVDRGFFPSGDFTDQFYVFSVFEARQLLQGHLPLWNPYTYGGHPFLADIQSAIFYPPSLLTILLSAPWGFPLYALELEAVAHVFLGGLFTYLFARRLLKETFPSLVAALTFAFGGYVTSYPVQQLAILEVDVWLPLILLLLSIAWDRLQEQGEKRGFVWAGMAFAVSLLAGHPQSSMYVFYVAALYWIYETHRAGGRLWPKVGLFLLFLLTGLSLAAVQLVPSVEFTMYSTRAQGTYAEMSHGFPLHDLLQILLPGILSQFSPLYVGILPLLLACLGVYLVRDRRVLFWGALALLALLLSLGGNTFLYSPFYLAVPGFGIFRGQERAAYVFSFCVAVLAGYGVSELFGSGSRMVESRLRRFNWALVLVVAVALLLVLVFLFGWLRAGLAVESPFGGMLNRAVLLLVFAAFGIGSVYAVQRRIASTRLLMAALALVIVFDLFTVNWQNNVQVAAPQEEYAPRTLLAPIQGGQGVARVYNEWRLPGHYGMVYEIEDIGGASPLRLEWYAELADAVPVERLWELMNVEYVLTWRGTLLAESQVLYEEPTGEDTTYLPRAYMVYHAEVRRGGEALELLADPDLDPSRTAVLEEEPGLVLGGGAASADPMVSFVEYQPTRILLDVETSADGILVLSEVYYPGWRAYVDGTETRILKADHALRAVELEAGSHRVEMVYDPLSAKVGIAISVSAVILILGLAVWSRFSRS